MASRAHPPGPGVCEMEQLLPSTTRKNKTWPRLARQECSRQANTAGEDGLAILPQAVLLPVLPFPHGSAGFKVLGLGFSLENLCLVCVWFFFFFSPSSLVILQLDELSILRVLPGFTPKVGLSGSTQSSV